MYSFLTGSRAESADFVAPTRFGMNNLWGIADQGKPTTQQIKDHLRGKLYACLRIRADAVANAIVGNQHQDGFQVLRRSGTDWEPAEGSPWLEILKNPNDARSAYEVWYWMQWAYDLLGVASLLVEDGSRMVPQSIHEIFPSFGEVRPIQSPSGGVDGWVYHRADGERIPLEARDIIQVQNTDPTTPFEGKSLLEVLSYQLDQELFADVYSRNTLQKGRPPLLQITFDQGVSPQQAEKFGEKFKKEFMDKTGDIKGVPVFGNGGKAEGIGIDPKGFQMIEQRELAQKLIHDVTGVPAAMFEQGSNRAEAEQAEKTFMERTVQPLVTRHAAQMTHGFRRSFGAGTDIKIMAPNVVTLSPKEKEELNKMRIARGVPPAQIMEEQGEEAPEGLDQPYLPGSLVPADSMGLM